METARRGRFFRASRGGRGVSCTPPRDRRAAISSPKASRPTIAVAFGNDAESSAQRLSRRRRASLAMSITPRNLRNSGISPMAACRQATSRLLMVPSYHRGGLFCIVGKNFPEKFRGEQWRSEGLEFPERVRCPSWVGGDGCRKVSREFFGGGLSRDPRASSTQFAPRGPLGPFSPLFEPFLRGAPRSPAALLQGAPGLFFKLPCGAPCRSHPSAPPQQGLEGSVAYHG